MSSLESSSALSDPPILLTVSNWYMWMPRMRNILMGRGLWNHATGKELEPVLSQPVTDSSRKAYSQWHRDEMKAISTLVDGCEPGIRSAVDTFAHHVGPAGKEETAASVWKHMTTSYGAPSTARMASIKYGMFLRRCAPGHNPSDFASWLQAENNKLQGSLYAYDNANLAMHLLFALPDNLDPLRQSFFCRPAADITFDNVHSALTQQGYTQEGWSEATSQLRLPQRRHR